MATSPLIPQPFWFRLEFTCPRDDRVPLPATRGRLLELPSANALPALAQLDGREPWAEVRVAWNPVGLAVAVQVTGKTGPVRGPQPEDPDFADGVQVWIDTRDTRDVHRATRYCHRFSAMLSPASGGKALAVQLSQRTIHRALADAPKVQAETIQRRAERLKDGWLLELFFPAGALNGYDPETNRRLGLMVLVTDPGRGEQFLGVGREFPVGEDPSLWPTLELVD